MTAALAPAQAALAATLLDARRPCPAGLRAWNGSDPAVRWAVYRNNVVSSLIDALADTFPVVQQLVGDEFFRAMAGLHVRQSPPRSRVLAYYGQDFPAFVAGFEPARALPYLADVARLELARVRAYHAADAEPVAAAAVARALARRELGDMSDDDERLAALRLVCQPSLSALVSRHAVVSLWAAHQVDGDGAIASVDIESGEAALVMRQGLQVLVLPVSVGAAAFVAALGQGLAFGAAAAVGAEAEASFDLAATLSLLLAHGALTAVDLPSALSS